MRAARRESSDNPLCRLERKPGSSEEQKMSDEGKGGEIVARVWAEEVAMVWAGLNNDSGSRGRGAWACGTVAARAVRGQG